MTANKLKKQTMGRQELPMALPAWSIGLLAVTFLLMVADYTIGFDRAHGHASPLAVLFLVPLFWWIRMLTVLTRNSLIYLAITEVATLTLNLALRVVFAPMMAHDLLFFSVNFWLSLMLNIASLACLAAFILKVRRGVVH